jgi:hypothetical protein
MMSLSPYHPLIPVSIMDFSAQSRFLARPQLLTRP